MKQYPFLTILFSLFMIITSCNNQESNQSNDSSKGEPLLKREAAIKVDSALYKAGNTSLKGFIAYDENKQGRRPVVLVVHEWWGLTEYPRARAKMLAELGYLAMAVDMYGDGAIADNPQDAQKMAGVLYQNPLLAKNRLDAALESISAHPLADTSRNAAIGYCFGGAVVLNAAKLGSDLNGVVSFHGTLDGVPAKKELLKAAVLICHGGADSFISGESVSAFKKSMDSIGANYTFKEYQGATHAFTNPESSETGKRFNMPITYNAAADSTSWNDMKAFLNQIFK